MRRLAEQGAEQAAGYGLRGTTVARRRAAAEPALATEVRSLLASVVSELTLKSGFRIVFVKGTAPPDPALVAIKPADMNNVESFADFVRLIDECASATVHGIHVWNRGGLWVRAAALAAKAGLDIAVVSQSPKSDEAMTDYRVVMRPDESDICFLPNYKCGYRSVNRFLRDNFPSCAAKPVDITNALNEFVSVSTLSSGFSFSFIRSPVTRFRSFYLDKFCRGTERDYEHWVQVYAALLGSETVEPQPLLELIAGVPPEFADRHWRSFRSNIYHCGQPLVQRVYDLSALAGFIEDISEYLGHEVSMPHERSTSSIVAPEVRAALSEPAFEDLVAETFAADQALYRDTMAEGGKIRLNQY